MIGRLVALTVVALQISFSARAQDGAQEAAIRALVADQVAAWDAGDAARFCASAAPDISAYNTSGADMSGKARFCQRQLQILTGTFKGTTKKQVIRRLRFITSDVAIVEIDNEIRGLKATPSGAPLSADGVSRTQLLEVFVRRDGGWLMEAFHNIDLAAPK
ncbi:MAG: SgcJ/EcaC family oxidoreductase [Alphaproteobacteria bacterium]|nr:MAG: SgcJ/EcaC family oxidoreductase [Alphaproteobacteria bacterium]